MFLPAYAAMLNKQRDELYAKATRPPHGTTGSIRNRILEWYNSLPEATRCRPYSMSEIEAAVKTQGRFISPVLIAEGWVRKRVWSSKKHYHRIWVPPKR